MPRAGAHSPMGVFDVNDTVCYMCQARSRSNRPPSTPAHTHTQTPNGRPYADYQEELGAVRSRPGWSKKWRRIRADYGFPSAPNLFAATITPQSTRLAATTASPQLAPSTPVRSPPPSPLRRHHDPRESGRRRLLLDLTGEDADDEGAGAGASTEEEEEQYEEEKEQEGDHDILSHIRRRPHPTSPSPTFLTPTPKPWPPLLASYHHQGRRRRGQHQPQMGEVLNFSEVRSWPIVLLVLGLPLALLLVLRAPRAEVGRAVWANMTTQRSA